jgi:hypothetical protein
VGFILLQRLCKMQRNSHGLQIRRAMAQNSHETEAVEEEGIRRKTTTDVTCARHFLYLLLCAFKNGFSRFLSLLLDNDSKRVLRNELLISNKKRIEISEVFEGKV